MWTCGEQKTGQVAKSMLARAGLKELEEQIMKYLKIGNVFKAIKNRNLFKDYLQRSYINSPLRLRSQTIQGENADIKLACEILISQVHALCCTSADYHVGDLTKQKDSPALWGSHLATQAHPATCFDTPCKVKDWV